MPPATKPLIGLATLTAHAFSGGDLTPTAEELFKRIEEHPEDAAAYIDLATIMLLSHQSDSALPLQQQAIALQPRYRLSTAPSNPSMRMLTLLSTGDLMDNTPVEFLLEGSSIAMELHFMQPGSPLPDDLDRFDLCFIAIGESDHNRPLLQQIDEQIRHAPIPVINRAQQIMQTTREGAAEALNGDDHLLMPASVRLTRQQLTELDGNLANYLPHQQFPIIVRPTSSHAGHGLIKLESSGDISTYLAAQPEEQFYISPFINYASSDRLFRKYRIALIDG
ncbi:MAG: hypothetical protein Q9M13_09120, partial [Mariprofundales bacterium]|nr:hypothetical protein [Mariprofundales bacterium]